jgi:hypothetical protein
MATVLDPGFGISLLGISNGGIGGGAQVCP